MKKKKNKEKIKKTDYKRFGNIEIEKQKFHQDKSTILIENIDVNKIIVSNKVSFGEKGFKCSINNKDAKNQAFMHISSKDKCIQKRV